MVGLVEAVEDNPMHRKAAVVVEVDIAEVDMVGGQEAGLLEDMAAAEVGHIVTQEVYKLVEVRNGLQPAVSCPVLHCSFLASVQDHDAETANA